MEVRADTYLWAIRFFKSRTLASEAIKNGRVKLNEQNFKPAHVVKIGEKFTISISGTKKIIEVIALLQKRGSFDIAKKHYNDLSPPAEKKGDFFPASFYASNIKREIGTGRPTKKQRRDQDDFREQ